MPPALPMNMTTTAEAMLAAAVQVVRRRSGLRPWVGIVLGSGLGGLADEVVEAVRIDFDDLPGFMRSTAAGHRGQLLVGSLDGVDVVLMAGRVHRYEGHSDAAVSFPVRLMAALGARRLIVSNAAGGLNPLLQVSDIVVIADHIDLARRAGKPLARLDAASELAGGGRGSSAAVNELYDRSLIQVALAAARASDFHACPGIYLATLGPTYETRAEYRMMRSFGADVVGMSTAPEVIVAKSLGMEVLGLSVVSNVAQPDALQSTSHQEVLAAGRTAALKLRKIIAAALLHPLA